MGKTLEGIVGAMSATVPSGLIVNLAFFGWFLSKVRSGVLRVFFTGQFMETPGSEENCTSEKFNVVRHKVDRLLRSLVHQQCVDLQQVGLPGIIQASISFRLAASRSPALHVGMVTHRSTSNIGFNVQLRVQVPASPKTSDK